MDSGKQIEIASTFINNGELSPEEAEQFISSLPEEVQSKVRIVYESSGLKDAKIVFLIHLQFKLSC